jgi:AbrB family looped-hinge helix DNA binding protein
MRWPSEGVSLPHRVLLCKAMAHALTARPQVTLPKAIRDHLKVAPGDAVDFRVVADGTVRVEPLRLPGRAASRLSAAARSRIDKLHGSG